MRRIPSFPFRALAVLSAGLAVTALGGCQSLQSSDNFLGVLTPYRIEVVQGNVVTKEQVALLRPGLSRAQVKDALGSPLVADAFHVDRWDYVFTIRRQGAEPQLRRVVVWFKGDTFDRIEGGTDLPGERDFVASIDTARSRSAPALALTEDEIKALPVPPPTPPVPAASAQPARVYPPLEPAT